MNQSPFSLNTRCPGRGIRPSRSASPSARAAHEEAPEQSPASPATALQTAAKAGPTPANGDSRDIYTIYLREIGQVPLLSPAEEIELAARIKQGDAAAREKLITANLRLVVKIAREYEGYGVPLLDLISEGNLGLMEAVTRFDPAKGAKLSTYAAWWIKQAIKRALAHQGKTIRLPLHVVAKLAHLRQAATRLQEELGREPGEEELAEELGLPLRKVGRLRALSLCPVPLDKPLNEDQDETIATVIADENCRTPDQELEAREVAQTLGQAIRGLSARELAILNGRFGLQDGTERTLKEMGACIGLTRERIRQIQNVALAKLRRSLEAQEAPGSGQDF